MGRRRVREVPPERIAPLIDRKPWLMAAPITATGTTLEPRAPLALFNTRIYGGGVDNQQGRQYDVSRDGRFLINIVVDDVASPITLLMNWNPAAVKK